MKLLQKVSTCSIVLLLYGLYLAAQSRTVTGVITDDKNNPLPRATVRMKNTQVATVADNSGKYKLQAPESAATLQISFTGMEPQEIPVRSVVSLMLACVRPAPG